MGGLFSRVSLLWKSLEPGSPAGLDTVHDPYEQFVGDVKEAVLKGNYEGLKQLQEEASMMLWGGIQCISTSPSIIQLAVVHGHEEILRFLIQLGMDVSQADTCGMTALHEACKGKQIGCVRLLINHSQNIDQRDVWGRTPLIKALVYRNTAAAELLLDKGANPNAVDIYGVTPLSTAIDYNMFEMVKTLVRHGADINLITQHQHMYKCCGPPLYQAMNNQNPDMVTLLVQLGSTTQPLPHHYRTSSRGPTPSNPWYHFSGSVSPTLQHRNAVMMAVSELIKRSHNLELCGPWIQVLSIILAAHGHTLDSSSETLIRLLRKRSPDFSMLEHKLHLCSCSNHEHCLAGNAGQVDSGHRIITRLQLRHSQGRSHGAEQTDNQPPRIAMSLENQARRVARQAVMASGKNVAWAVERLQCPPALKNLLLLKDIDKAFSHLVLKKLVLPTSTADS